jgi:bifunctional DNA-binding transcriptional regulator/antitoxin component of YhaV-PrlF toxin-antitoxin module
MQFNNEKKGIKLIKITEIYNDRIYCPKEIRKLMNLKNRDKIIFGQNDKQQIILLKNEEITETETKRFKVYESDIDS